MLEVTPFDHPPPREAASPWRLDSPTSHQIWVVEVPVIMRHGQFLTGFGHFCDTVAVLLPTL